MYKYICSLVALVAFTIPVAAQLYPVNLTCEYMKDPLGIDIHTPRFSWQFTSTERNQFLHAYELIVSNDISKIEKGTGSTWTSGQIKSGENTNIIYAGQPLQSFTRYYWRVRVRSGEGKLSAWSAIASFETAMLAASDWKADWINDGQQQFEKDEDFYQEDPMPLFRKQIIIKKKIATARLYISGLGYYEAYLNNNKIGENKLDPGFTTYRKEVLYVTHDITRLLKKGNNTLGVMLGNGWWNALPLRLFGRFNIRDVQQTGRPCLKAQIHISYTDGSREMVRTDETWETAPGPILRNSVYLGETYDARKEKPFESKSGWNKAVTATGPDGQLSAQLVPPIRVTKVLRPISVKEIGKDTFLVDMGQNFAGFARIKLNAPEGTRISLRFGEDTFKNGHLNYLTTVAGHIKEIWNLKGGPGSPKTAWQQDVYIAKGGGFETWAPRFTFHGFRYVEITGWPGKPGLQDIEGLRLQSDLAPAGSFSCSYQPFNKLHEVIQWTFLSNVFSVQSDCPGREKMGYGADIVVTAPSYMYNYDMSQFYRKTVKDFANDQQPDGGITEIAPYTGIADKGYGGQSGPLGWQLAFPYVQQQLHSFYGDKQIIAANYEAIKKQLEFLNSKSVDGLFHWDISDHEALDPKPEAFSASAFYYHHALLAAEFADILKQTADKEKFTKLAKDIKNRIIRKYAVPSTGRFDNATQSAQLFALWYSLADNPKAALEVLMKEFERHKNHISTGIFSTRMLFDVLREQNEVEKMFELVSQKTFPGWIYMLENGATTLWETWAYPENAPSQNHPMFGSVEAYFYESIAGIKGLSPGFDKIRIHPQAPKALTWAKGEYHSIKGLIRSEWKKEGDTFFLSVTIPANTTAEIWLPTASYQTISENGKKIDAAEITRIENDYKVLTVGSGRYEYVVK